MTGLPLGEEIPCTAAGPGEGGAIAAAAEWCAAARDLPDPPSLLAFGSRESVLVLVGESRSLCLRRYAGEPVPEEDLWNRLEEFCRRPGFMAGYIGFDAVWPDGMRRPVAPSGDAMAPTLHFWEPAGVIRIDAPAGRSAGATVLGASATLEGLRPRPLGPCEVVPLRRHDRESRPFRESVALTIESIRRGEGKRLTLARRIELPDDLDLLASFSRPPRAASQDVGRSFYAATPALELAGHSPELLGRGDRDGFVCYKLSGTGPRHPDPATDARLRAALLADAKVRDEHALSLQSTRHALEAAGTVTAGDLEILERRGLRHLMTPLTVATRPGTSWSTIMKALLPSGAQPRDAGLQSLDGLERVSRGAYYGILGVRTPDGRFEFSQVLRTLFRDPSGVYTFVGAAVTGGSTVDGENDETRLKLDDVVAMRAVGPSAQREQPVQHGLPSRHHA